MWITKGAAAGHSRVARSWLDPGQRALLKIVHVSHDNVSRFTQSAISRATRTQSPLVVDSLVVTETIPLESAIEAGGLRVNKLGLFKYVGFPVEQLIRVGKLS